MTDMEKTYESIGIFPLEFADRQQVEAGETFKRDFEKASTTDYDGLQHERWLVELGHIRYVPDVVTKSVSKPTTFTLDKV